jgi:hypothetical protein
MKFIGMDPIDNKPAIEIVSGGKSWDLHNTAYFPGHKYAEYPPHRPNFFFNFPSTAFGTRLDTSPP